MKRLSFTSSIKVLAAMAVGASLAFAPTLHAKKILRYCSEGSPSNFNPMLSADSTSYNANSDILHDRLIQIPAGEVTTSLGLAISWQVSADQLTYTFKLRKGVKFHTTPTFTPTRDFNADDVLFSFNRQRLANHPFHHVSGGSYEYFRSLGMNSLIKDIVKVDAHTVQFILSRKDVLFLMKVGMDYSAIQSKEYADALLKAGTPEKIDVSPVGTGPFMLKKYAKDSTIRYVRHPHYFRGAAKLDGVVTLITPDANVRTQKLLAGECDIVAQPAFADIDRLKTNNAAVVLENSGLNVGYVAINTKKKPFDNVLVRQAINHAMNRKAYVEAIYLGKAKAANSPIPPSTWGNDGEPLGYEHDPKKAKALLKQAGLPNGFSTELWALPVIRPYNPNGKKMAELMQADLAQVGIKVKIVTYDWPTYLAKSKVGEHSLIQLGWNADTGDPDDFMNLLLTCSGVNAGMNRSGWCNKAYDSIIAKTLASDDQAVRTKHYKAAQAMFRKHAPWAIIAYANIYAVTNKKVSGYKLDIHNRDLFYEVDLK